MSETSKPIRDDRDGERSSADPKQGEPRDNGYGESHGYPPGHGGPTGPGDAPAKPGPST